MGDTLTVVADSSGPSQRETLTSSHGEAGQSREMVSMQLVDLQAAPPPADWGVVVDHAAIEVLADQWAHDDFALPAFDYPGTPTDRPESSWFDYVVRAVSALACLWPPDGDSMWAAEHEGAWLDDAPGIFATFTRHESDPDYELFSGRGTLQLLAERRQILEQVNEAIADRWHGTALNLVEEAGRNGTQIAALLTATIPGYLDRPSSAAGVLPFDKLSHLAATIMAAGLGWSDAGFGGYDDFPVYPDYMLPRVFRHVGVMVYETELADRIDRRQLIEADSVEEHALRWATVYSGAALRTALVDRGNPVTAPALDYRLWFEAVLGPDAASFGEHHRTLTLHY